MGCSALEGFILEDDEAASFLLEQDPDEISLRPESPSPCFELDDEVVAPDPEAHDQQLVIMVNTYLNLRKLSQKKLADLCACLPGADPKVTPYSLRAAAAILGVPPGTLLSIYQRVKNNGWAPLEPASRPPSQADRGRKRQLYQEENATAVQDALAQHTAALSPAALRQRLAVASTHPQQQQRSSGQQ
ncbi:unnamed protein product [Effrenium voratum]|nr:unnamed protein product [Effrenium voratum]